MRLYLFWVSQFKMKENLCQLQCQWTKMCWKFDSNMRIIIVDWIFTLIDWMHLKCLLFTWIVQPIIQNIIHAKYRRRLSWSSKIPCWCRISFIFIKVSSKKIHYLVYWCVCSLCSCCQKICFHMFTVFRFVIWEKFYGIYKSKRK